MPFLTVFPAGGKRKSPRHPLAVPGSFSSTRQACRRRSFAPACCPRRQRRPELSVWASKKRRDSVTRHCCRAQPKTVSLLLMTLRPLKTRFFRSHRSPKEQEELWERVDHCVTAELGPFAQRPMLQKTKSNASHTTCAV